MEKKEVIEDQKEKREHTQDYWNNSAPSYSDSIKKELVRDEKVIWTDLILENAPEIPEGGRLKILDIGCGPGFFSIIMAKQGHDVTGVDVTPNMLDEARANAAAEGVSPEFRQMDSHEPDFADDTFDLIISRNVTWTLYAPEKAYAEWKRILKPGGRLLLFDGNWYIHMFDKEKKDRLFADVRKYREAHGDIPLRSTIFQFEDYWRELPMIGRERPLWDVSAFWQLRFGDIVVNKDITDRLAEKETSSIYASTPMFMIRGTKMTEKEEIKNDIKTLFDGQSPLFGLELDRLLDTEDDSFYKKCIKPLLPGSGGKLLDAGCGAGLISAFAAKDGFDVTGVDFAPRMIDEYAHTMGKHGIKAEGAVSDLECLSFGDDTFDVVVLKDVLWCCLEPDMALNECIRVLKPGGRLIIADSDRYMHLHNKDKDEYVKKWRPVSEATNKVLYGVDDRRAAVIDKIADKLPLSSEKRPDWDREYLKQKGLVLDEVVIIDESEMLPEGFVASFVK